MCLTLFDKEKTLLPISSMPDQNIVQSSGFERKNFIKPLALQCDCLHQSREPKKNHSFCRRLRFMEGDGGRKKKKNQPLQPCQMFAATNIERSDENGPCGPHLDGG